MATIRADGSPRISGIECEFVGGELRFGSMPGARKADDIRRDPRVAIHGPSCHPEVGAETSWPGEAKVSGSATAVGPVASDGDGDPAEGDLFTVDVAEVVMTGLNEEGSMLVIESWTPQRGFRRVERA